MTPEIDKAFARLKNQHGSSSLERVELMMQARGQDREPLQKGAKYVLPGISKKPWHDPYEHASLLPLVRQLEAQHPAIKAEFAKLWSDRARAFDNYQHYLMTRDDWKAFYIYRNGALTPESAKLTPATHRVLTEFAVQPGLLCPLLESHFSTLTAGAVIPPHCDLWNFSINLHLAVDIPNDCVIRVANEDRAWTEGKCLLFDYSYLHEAWNRGDRARTCLLLDLWHPEVTMPERQALTTLITEIRRLTAEPAAPAPKSRRWSPLRLFGVSRGA
jgi:aspartyl/asparaginyl beta-hydroxylase (cupin superfamily)